MSWSRRSLGRVGKELERIDLKASILLSVCSLALAALVHAAAYLHWDPGNSYSHSGSYGRGWRSAVPR